MNIKKIYICLLAVMLIGLNSCKKETVDVTHLLTTVPSSASGVVVMNLEGILEDAGCKVKEHTITPSKEVSALLEKSSAGDQEDYKMLFDGEIGIEPKGAVMFYDSNRAFLTFALYDVNKYCNYVESKTGDKFVEGSNGVKLNGNVAVKGAQAWVCMTRGKIIDSDAIASYASLKDSQSFLVTPMGEKLLTEENDVRGWALINTFMNEMLSRNDRSMFTLGMGFLFSDAESVRFKVDFEKGELEGEFVVLNDKYKPAKYLLPSEKVDINTLKTLGTTCDGMMAFTVNSKLIKKFEQISSAFGGALFGDLSESMKNVEGTIGVIASSNGEDESFNGVITTKGEVSPALRDLISRIFAPVSQDGKFLRFSQGDVKGSLNVEECAEDLKGCCLGLVVDASGLKSTGYGSAPQGFKNLILKFQPESGGLEMELEIKTTDPKENALLTILKNMK